jgi:hypothetical protein
MKRREIVHEEKHEPTQQEVREDALAGWAQDPRCLQAFLPMLMDRLEELQDKMPSLAEQPGKQNVVVGAHDELKSLYKKFLGYLEE